MVPQPRVGILLTSLEIHGICETPKDRSVWTGLPYLVWIVFSVMLLCLYVAL